MSGSYTDPRWMHPGRDPRSEQRQTSQARPSRDDDHRPAVYNPPAPAPYQVAPPQPSYNQVPAQYAPSRPPPSHPPPHALVPPQAFPPQRGPTHPYALQGPYAPPSQPPPPPQASARWHTSPPSISNADSGNTENSTIGGSYNNNSTRTDHRVNAQVAAHMSNAQTVFIQNLHVSPTSHHPSVPITSVAFPSLSGHSARPMDHLTAQMRETTITSSERRYQSHPRIPNPDDADFDNRYVDQSRNNKPKTRRTIPGQQEEDEYDNTQGQRGYPGEGSSRGADPRSSYRPDRSSRSIPIPQSMVHDRRDYSRERDDSSRAERETKGDKYSRKPPQDMFNPYSSSNHLPTDPRSLSSSHLPPSPRHQEDEDDYNEEDSSSDDSGSNSGSETEAPTPCFGRSARRGGGARRIHPNASAVLTRPSVDNTSYHGSSDPSAISKSKSQQQQPSMQQSSSSRQDQRSRADTDFVVGSYRSEGPSGLSKAMSQQSQSWVGGQPAASDSQSRSGHKEKESSRPSAQQSSSRTDPRSRGKDEDYVPEDKVLVGGYRGEPSESQTRSGHKERETARSSVQHSSSRPDPRVRTDEDYTAGRKGRESMRSSPQEISSRASSRVRGTDDDYASDGQGVVGSYRGEEYASGLNRFPYTERDNRASTETLARSPPNQSSIPQRKEENSPPYNTRGSGWGREGSSQPPDPSRTKSYGPYSPTDTTRPPQYGAPYSPSQVQGSSGSHPWGGHPAGPPPGWSAHPPNPGSIVAPPMRGSQSYSSGDKESRYSTSSSTHPSMQRRLTDIVESQVYNPSQQTLSYKIPSLGNPCLVPFIKGKGNENLGLSKNVDSHTPLYMCSNIIDPDTIAFWFPAPTLFPPSGGRRGVQLGDLGYFDDSGEFRPIFNIFHSYDQNVAQGARPPSPPYQHLHIDRNWVRQVDIQRQQTYTSSNIEKRGDVGPHTQQPYQFRTYKNTGRSGAIIVLPHGGSSSCIRNAYFHLPEVKRHFREHAPSWYQHALQYIPKKTNGSLILVRATHCARSWGIAAFASKRDIREPLTATFMSHPANEYQQMWQTNDSKWKTSTGPSSLELKELGGREPPLNQCIGVVISSLRLDDATWQANFANLASPSDRGGGWGLRRVMSRESWSTIHVNDTSGRTTRRLLDSIRGRPTDIRQPSGGDDYTLLLQEP